MTNKLMLGLWRYVIHVPSFLWERQIARGRNKIQKVYEGFGEETRRVHHFVVRQLPCRKEPLSLAFISESLNLSSARVAQALDHLEKNMTFLYRNKEGLVTWAYPVTVDKTPHRLKFSTGEEIFAA